MWPGNETSNAILQLGFISKRKRAHNGQVACLIMNSYRASSSNVHFAKLGRGNKVLIAASDNSLQKWDSRGEELRVHVRAEGHRKERHSLSEVNLIQCKTLWWVQINRTKNCILKGFLRMEGSWTLSITYFNILQL